MKTLVEQLADVDAQLARHQLSSADTNPAGDIGGIRSRSAKQKARILARYNEQAREYVKLMDERARLIARLNRQISAVVAYMSMDLIQLARWDALVRGDVVPVGHNSVTIRRKHAYSFADTLGNSWGITEITGLSRKRIEELRGEGNRRYV